MEDEATLDQIASSANTVNALSDEELKLLKKAEKKAARIEKNAEKKAKPPMPKWLRLITILFTINFLLTLVSNCFTSRDLVEYNPVRLLDYLNIVLEVVTLWMLWCRFKTARPFVIIYACINMLIGLAIDISGGSFDIVSYLLGSLFDIMLILYFATSRKTRAYLTEPFGIEREQALPYAKELHIDRKSWPFYRNLIIYYCFFSLAGHWMEAGCCKLMEWGILDGEVDYNNTMLWRDWFYPFPMEGLAVVLIAVALYPLFTYMLKKFRYPGFAYLFSFIANALVCGLIEFSMGLVVNANLQLWNYTDLPFNIMGQVCLQNMVGFGMAASIICWIIYPALERLFQRIPKNIMNLALVITIAAYMIPQTLYLVDPPVPYRVELQEILDDPDMPQEMKDEAQQELDKLNALEAKGSQLAGAPDKEYGPAGSASNQ